MGRDRSPPEMPARAALFQSTLPAWGETLRAFACSLQASYFNPLSPHGERLVPHPLHKHLGGFQSTLPAWGETNTTCSLLPSTKFQSTLPAWGETCADMALPVSVMHFNPLSPHGERLCVRPEASRHSHFNPLSPHGERPGRETAKNPAQQFQSTLPAWGETRC